MGGCRPVYSFPTRDYYKPDCWAEADMWLSHTNQSKRRWWDRALEFGPMTRPPSYEAYSNFAILRPYSKFVI